MVENNRKLLFLISCNTSKRTEMNEGFVVKKNVFM